ncbi:MAG TPA: chemotaxis protein CheA [Candidatus Tyrphobacter sp.]
MPDEPFDRAEFVAYFRDESEELLHRIDADSLRLEDLAAAGTYDAEVVNSLFRALHTIKGNAAMLGFAEVSELAHSLESLCDALRTQRLALSGARVELLLRGRDLLNELVECAVGGGDSPRGLAEFLERLDDAVPRDVDAAQASGDAFEAEVARMLAQSPDSRAPLRDATPRVPGRRPTIRVDIERLDALMNLVGELVVNRTRITEIAASLARLKADDVLVKALSESAALLARTSGEIQASLMKARMVPIGQVFERFPRLVRDVAKARHKEVQLEINGAQTELDKTIVDEIGEPLMHLVRNCIDHGIETPEEREAAGKPRVGTISLNAYHGGNQIIIEVADDGRGIDLDLVRARGIALGLISQDERLTEQETVELIFTPGFSTAAAVSELSGRGVGMDVVKKNVTRLKGAFEVDTEGARGTRFTIKLPLTLAIIAALLVRVSEELFAIPLDSVIESQRVERADIRTVQGHEVVTLREQIVPLLRIAEFFELGGIRDPEKAMAVIVGVQGRQVGLVVDAFEGEQEIVIKPLSDVVGRIPGISGATILGSGAISLIIDVHALVTDAYGTGRIARAEYSGV